MTKIHPYAAIVLTSAVFGVLARILWLGIGDAQAQPVRVDPECIKAPVFAHLPCEPTLVSPSQQFVATGGIGELLVDVTKPDGTSFQILARRVVSPVVDGFIVAIPPNLPEGLYFLAFSFYPEQNDGCVVGDTRAYRILP